MSALPGRMNISTVIDDADVARWYCLRAQPKHEHIAAAQLQRALGLEIFCPRVRFQRRTRSGLKWFVEALFPCYLFARFALAERRAQVRYSPGVAGILQFGERFAAVPDEAIAQLGAIIGAQEVKTLDFAVAEGDDVEIISGPLRGQRGVVTHLHSARERVRILLEFLGQTREVEVSLLSVFRQRPALLV